MNMAGGLTQSNKRRTRSHTGSRLAAHMRGKNQIMASNNGSSTHTAPSTKADTHTPSHTHTRAHTFFSTHSERQSETKNLAPTQGVASQLLITLLARFPVKCLQIDGPGDVTADNYSGAGADLCGRCVQNCLTSGQTVSEER